MTIRMLTAYAGMHEFQVVTLASEEETRLIGLGFATTDLDGPDGTAVEALAEHSAAHTALGITTVADTYADDAAAAAGGVPVGGLYNVAGVVHIRLA